MSKVYAVLLVGVALFAMAIIGTLSLVMVTDFGYLAYRLLKPGKYPWGGAVAYKSHRETLRFSADAVAAKPHGWQKLGLI